MAKLKTVTVVLLVGISSLLNPDQCCRESYIFMVKAAAADSPRNPAPESMTPAPRDPAIAVEEEYRLAKQRGTAQALELFMARHPDSPLAKKARDDLNRMNR